MQEDWGDEGGGDGESDEENEPVPSFPELTQQISSAIESLGGSVLPKLNWSSPRVRCVCVRERQRGTSLSMSSLGCYLDISWELPTVQLSCRNLSIAKKLGFHSSRFDKNVSLSKRRYRDSINILLCYSNSESDSIIAKKRTPMQ